jgi:hypothetical protein
MKRVIRSDKPVTVLLLFWSHKCDIGAEPRNRIIATSAVKGLKANSEWGVCVGVGMGVSGRVCGAVRLGRVERGERGVGVWVGGLAQ